MEDIVMVVYAYERNATPGNVFKNSPLIYDIYRNHYEGFDKMVELQSSEEYGHLIWTNKIMKIK